MRSDNIHTSVVLGSCPKILHGRREHLTALSAEKLIAASFIHLLLFYTTA